MTGNLDDLGRFAEPSLYILVSLSDGPKHGYAVIAALHAQVTLQLLTDSTAYAPGFTSMLFTLERVAGVFDEMYRPFRFRIERSPECLICRAAAVPEDLAGDDLDAALDQALARMTRHASPSRPRNILR